ncbi:nitroreductase [Mycolicibacterium duvalii]|uniref:nitroreductase family protein n=1 Tax=Mycolicibacterium duvalii TaxID=39688 RepID=UPI000BEEF111|nr:nitroreductase family protein [Mycolicibacterium duvalii]MCV7368218.1 nitroreductase family protein [Mycolicibacterium duvalii]PEG43307.1 nitroreductase [Mycolicibacterium duvalii]
MAADPSGRTAHTSVPIHPPIAERWSPRAFDPNAEVSPAEVSALLEAARWAPTWGRRQPVRFAVGIRGDETFVTVAGTLRRGNSYAHAASALIVLCADEGEDERTALYSAVDVGAAMANLCTEAVTRGLITHPMAGFSPEALRTGLDLSDLRPLVVVAVGRLGDYATAPAEIAERDSRPRARLPLSEIVLNWNDR